MRATGIPAGTAGGLRCPTAFVPIDAVLRHLQAGYVTGELRIEMEEETVLVCYEQGQVVMLTSNHPRNYCAGAACDFQAVPRAVIGEAVRAQQEQSLPFFISLKLSGELPQEAALESLLRDQGLGCLRRAFKSSQAVAVFSPLARLSATARSCKVQFPLNQLLLECYRTVDDWFTLEKFFQDMDATLVPSLELESELEELALSAEESRLLSALRPGQTVPELAEATGMKPFEICRILFRFIKLGLIRQEQRSNRSGGRNETATCLVVAADTAQREDSGLIEVAGTVTGPETVVADATAEAAKIVDSGNPAATPGNEECSCASATAQNVNASEPAPTSVPTPESSAEAAMTLVESDLKNCNQDCQNQAVVDSEPTFQTN